MNKYDFLRKRDGEGCHYCGRLFGDDKWQKCTIDHKVPKSLGGKNDWENLVLACGRCNVLKGSKEYEFFKKNLPKILAQLEALSSPKVRKQFIFAVKKPKKSFQKTEFTLTFEPEKAYQMAQEHYKKYGKRGLSKQWLELIEETAI